MRTLAKIIEAADRNAMVERDELRYAICVLNHLASFDRTDLLQAASAEKEARASGAWSRYKHSCLRWNRAFTMSPKDWLGWNDDPANPVYQRRKAEANRLLSALRKEEGHQRKGGDQKNED